MNTRFISVLVVGLLGSGISVTYTADSLAEKEATSTIKERLTTETIKGMLMKIEGEYYFITDNDGKEHKIHVDKHTKLDQVFPHYMVKAYVTDEGHATTLQRVD